MTEVERIVDQIERSFTSDAWHGPSVLEACQGVDAAMANLRWCPDAHTIWELVLHLRATMDILLGRIHGDVGDVEESVYWPTSPDDPSESSWQTLLKEFSERHRMLTDAIASFNPSKLDQPLFLGGSPAYNNFLGHAQHNAYHAGQITILKKFAFGGAPVAG